MVRSASKSLSAVTDTCCTQTLNYEDRVGFIEYKGAVLWVVRQITDGFAYVNKIRNIYGGEKNVNSQI